MLHVNASYVVEFGKTFKKIDMIEQLIRLEFRLTALKLKELTESHEQNFKEMYESGEMNLEDYMHRIIKISEVSVRIDEIIKVADEMPLFSVLEGLKMFKEGLGENYEN